MTNDDDVRIQLVAAFVTIAATCLMPSLVSAQGVPSDCGDLYVHQSTTTASSVDYNALFDSQQVRCWRFDADGSLGVKVAFSNLTANSFTKFYVGAGTYYPVVAYIGPATFYDADFVFVRMERTQSGGDGGWSLDVEALDSGEVTGTCGDGVVGLQEGCDDGGNGTCVADCTAPLANAILPTACSTHFADVGEEDKLSRTSTDNDICWSIAPAPGADAVRVEVLVGALDNCCELRVNGKPYAEYSALVFGGADPVEIRFVNNDDDPSESVLTAVFSNVLAANIGSCGDGSVGPTESCDTGASDDCPENCQGYPTTECEADRCALTRDVCREFKSLDELPAVILRSASPEVVWCWDVAPLLADPRNIRMRASATYVTNPGDKLIASRSFVAIVDGPNTAVVPNDEPTKEYFFDDADDLFIVAQFQAGIISYNNSGDIKIFIDVCDAEYENCETATDPEAFGKIMLMIFFVSMGLLVCFTFCVCPCICLRQSRIEDAARAARAAALEENGGGGEGGDGGTGGPGGRRAAGAKVDEEKGGSTTTTSSTRSDNGSASSLDSSSGDSPPPAYHEVAP